MRKRQPLTADIVASLAVAFGYVVACQGSRASILLMGWSAIFARTLVKYACGSTSFSLAGLCRPPNYAERARFPQIWP